MKNLRNTFELESKQKVLSLCERARDLKNARAKRQLEHTMRGRVLAMLFEKHSTRTRVSFEAGMALLGGSSVVMQARDTQVQRGEIRRDSARVIGGYVDLLMIRTYAQADIDAFARHASVPVINGLSDLDHPCQILTDLFTLFERRENAFDLTWCYVGAGNNMSNGYIAASALMGFKLKLACPKDYPPDADYLSRARAMGADIELYENASDAVSGADVVCTDVWTSMGEESEAEERRAIFEPYQVNRTLLQKASDDHLVLHCLPAHRGEEITDDVLEGRHSVVFQQAQNRLPVQQAIMECVLGVPPFA